MSNVIYLPIESDWHRQTSRSDLNAVECKEAWKKERRAVVLMQLDLADTYLANGEYDKALELYSKSFL